MQSVVMLSVIMLSVIMLIVVAPLFYGQTIKVLYHWHQFVGSILPMKILLKSEQFEKFFYEPQLINLY